MGDNAMSKKESAHSSTKAESALRKAADCLKRAQDGLPLESFRGETLNYCRQQCALARQYVEEAQVELGWVEAEVMGG
jgi:hypothetical protein